MDQLLKNHNTHTFDNDIFWSDDESRVDVDCDVCSLGVSRSEFVLDYALVFSGILVGHVVQVEFRSHLATLTVKGVGPVRHATFRLLSSRRARTEVKAEGRQQVWSMNQFYVICFFTTLESLPQAFFSTAPKKLKD